MKHHRLLVPLFVAAALAFIGCEPVLEVVGDELDDLAAGRQGLAQRSGCHVRPLVNAWARADPRLATTTAGTRSSRSAASGTAGPLDDGCAIALNPI